MAASKAENKISTFFERGEPFVWISALGLTAVLAIVGSVFFIVSANGLGVFWPKPIHLIHTTDGEPIMGELVLANENHEGQEQLQYKIGNRDLVGLDFKWLKKATITGMQMPPEAYVLERIEYGNFYGFLQKLDVPNSASSSSDTNADLDQQFQRALTANHLQLADLKERRRELQYINRTIESYGKKPSDPRDIEEVARLTQQANDMIAALEHREAALAKEKALFQTADGKIKEQALMDIVRFLKPNQMSFWDKVSYNAEKILELFLANPRESNTEGGLFPAIFGTVMLIIIMSILSFPLGVLAGIYLNEYAQAGALVRFVRIAVNNLAGIPSIVYGIFGLGFFVYGIGSSLDGLLFSENLPEPTFGTGGILWASLTLGLLTIPVVIVATEEALSAVPKAVRENSYALGATKFQTLIRISLPAASGGILTGFILSMARAAGEVAPLMITGVVKMAPSLPVDRFFPFVHLERKFMHLGFHIYDISCQSPNVEAAKPMIYVTTLLLIVIVLSLSGLAIYLRERLKKKYQLASI